MGADQYKFTPVVICNCTLSIVSLQYIKYYQQNHTNDMLTDNVFGCWQFPEQPQQKVLKSIKSLFELNWNMSFGIQTIIRDLLL